MDARLMLVRLAIHDTVQVEGESLLVTTYACRLYRCPLAFPFCRLTSLAFGKPRIPDTLFLALHGAHTSQVLLRWAFTFTTHDLNEWSYLIWWHWADDSIELQLATPSDKQ